MGHAWSKGALPPVAIGLALAIGSLAHAQLPPSLSAAVAPAAAPAAAPASGTAPAAPSAAPPSPISVSEVAVDAQQVQGRLGDIQDTLQNDHSDEFAADDLDAALQVNSVRIREARRLLNARPSLETLRGLESGWQGDLKNITSMTHELTRRATTYDSRLDELSKLSAIWQATGKAASAAGAPQEVNDRIDETIKAIAKTRALIESRRTRVLALQSKAADLAMRIDQTRDSIADESRRAVGRLVLRDSQPMWRAAFWQALSQSSLIAGQDSATSPLAAMKDFFGPKSERVAFHLAITLAIVVGLFVARRKVRGWADEADLKRAAQVFETPIATGLVIGLVLADFIYPGAPLVFREGLGLVGLIPIVVILRRLIEPSLYPILYALAGFYLVDRLRGLAATAHALSRLILLIELGAGLALLLPALRRSRRAAAGATQRPSRRRRLLHLAAWIGLVIAALALVAELLGFAELGGLVGSVLLRAAYLALVLYALVRVIDGLVTGLSQLPPLSYLSMFRDHRPLICSRIALTLAWGAGLLWVLAIVNALGLWDAASDALDAVLAAAIHIGTIAISVQKLVGFVVAMFGALYIARFVSFLLDEEVFPKMRMERGLPYLISTMMRYTILFCGFVFGLAALGIDMTKFTILAGAFSVGLGFGLQNIVNNFVSGLIVLFERPMKIGDVVQFGDVLGQVERIGIRASVIRSANGAEVIIPNGTLISSNLTNWTFSNKSRRLDVQIQVALDADPDRVKSLLVEAARSHSDVSQNPPPLALLTKLGPDTLEFELRVWSDAATDWARIRSDLVSTIEAALKRDAISLK
ncbi:MAG: mechanosensitive ion channel domain-containing protein [Burkholderiaceae bacterium]